MLLYGFISTLKEENGINELPEEYPLAIPFS